MSSSPPAHRRHRARPLLAAPARTVSLLVVLVLAVAGCSVRLDLPPPAVPEPDSDETIRQEQAHAVTTILELSAAVQDGPDLSALDQDATAHLEALGGVWQPPPRPDDPPAADSGVQSAQVAEVLTALEGSAEAARAGAMGAGDDLAVLLVSIATNHHLHATWLREALDLEQPAADDAPQDSFPSTVGPEASDLIRLLDAAGYVAELRAARTGGDGLAEQAEQLRAQADLVAARGDVTGSGADPRQAIYDVDLQALDEEAAALEQALVPAWLELLGPAQAADRELITAQVLTAAERVYTDPESLPAFPGRAQ